MIPDIQKADDGSVSIYQDANIIYMNQIEAQEFKRLVNEVI